MKRTIFLFMITLMVSCKNDIPDVKENSHLLSTVVFTTDYYSIFYR